MTSAEGKAAQRPLGGIVAKSDPAILKEAGKLVPALEQIVYGLGNAGRA